MHIVSYSVSIVTISRKQEDTMVTKNLPSSISDVISFMCLTSYDTTLE